MSFILDALRKSEHERQRQTGPALAEVPVAAPKPRSNVWATGAIALLLVNLLVIGVLLIRKAAREPEATVPAAMPAPAQAAAPAATAPAPAQRHDDADRAVRSGSRAAARCCSPRVRHGRQPTARAIRSRTRCRKDRRCSTRRWRRTLPPRRPVRRRSRAHRAARGSVVYESLPASAAVGGQQYAAPQQTRAACAVRWTAAADCRRGDRSGRRTGPATSTCTCIRPRPPERFVFVNSHKYHEGDTLQEGPIVRADHAGRRRARVPRQPVPAVEGLTGGRS